MSRPVLSENRPFIAELEFCWTLMVSVMPCPSFFLILIWGVFRLWNPRDAQSNPDFCPGSFFPCSLSLSLVLINDLVIKGEPELEKEQGYG